MKERNKRTWKDCLHIPGNEAIEDAINKHHKEDPEHVKVLIS